MMVNRLQVLKIGKSLSKEIANILENYSFFLGINASEKKNKDGTHIGAF